jgi:hypothetical protein
MLLTLLVAIAKPTTAIVPFRTTAAAFTTNSRRDASALQTHSATGLGKVRREVPLPSEVAPKGALQYALYVTPATFVFLEKIAFATQILDCTNLFLSTGPRLMPSPTGLVSPPFGP